MRSEYYIWENIMDQLTAYFLEPKMLDPHPDSATQFVSLSYFTSLWCHFLIGEAGIIRLTLSRIDLTWMSMKILRTVSAVHTKGCIRISLNTVLAVMLLLAVDDEEQTFLINHVPLLFLSTTRNSPH